LVGSVPNNYGSIGRGYTALTNIFGSTHHVSAYPTDRWIGIFEGAGFRARRMFGELPICPDYTIPIYSLDCYDKSFNFMFVWEKP
jgi:hypothetical protein